MDEIREKKQEIRDEITQKITRFSPPEQAEKTRSVENRLFEFANFLEAKIVLLYVHSGIDVNTEGIIRRSYDYNKIVALPSFDISKRKVKIFKVDNFSTDLTVGPEDFPVPNPDRCKNIPLDCVDIAIMPAVALDEKGARLGDGKGYYDRLIPKLSITTRKVALAFEEQILAQVPMESHDKYVDIIITENRIIYKI